MNTIIVYPGRFQLFGPHHAKAYLYLISMFGPNNVFVVTSNKTDQDESPFNFSEKLSFISQYVPPSKIKMVTSPYKATELLQNYDLSQTKVIFAYSYKDVGRISYVKNNGDPGYFQPWTNDNLETADKHGYILTLPQFRIPFHGKELSGTYIRSLLKNMSVHPEKASNKTEFRRLFGFFNNSIYLHTLKKLEK